MLIDTGVTIAYKCSSCGSFEFINISLFAFLDKKGNDYFCRCGNSAITVKHEKSNRYSIRIPCIGCGGEHVYLLEKKDILQMELKVFNCPITGIQLCIMGNDEIVRKKVDCLEEEFDEIINLFGYDSYFRNTQVMFDTLNKIHDIAEQGNLICECGCAEIELMLLSDCILLKCAKCGTSQLVRAATNEDLKHILGKQYILISDERTGYPLKTSGKYMRKTDGK